MHLSAGAAPTFKYALKREIRSLMCLSCEDEDGAGMKQLQTSIVIIKVICTCYWVHIHIYVYSLFGSRGKHGEILISYIYLQEKQNSNFMSTNFCDILLFSTNHLRTDDPTFSLHLPPDFLCSALVLSRRREKLSDDVSTLGGGLHVRNRTITNALPTIIICWRTPSPWLEKAQISAGSVRYFLKRYIFWVLTRPTQAGVQIIRLLSLRP